MSYRMPPLTEIGTSIRHRRPAMESIAPHYVLQGLGTTASAKRYWDQMAQQCKQFADEGECLARVAKHVPVTIEPPAGGLGISAEDLTGAIDVAAQIVRDPHAVLKARGPAIVSAIDQQILDPTIASVAEGLAPYIIKYVVPPIAVLYFLVGLSTYYSYKSYRAHPTVPNRKRRRRRRRRKRTSKR